MDGLPSNVLTPIDEAGIAAKETTLIESGMNNQYLLPSALGMKKQFDSRNKGSSVM